MDRIDAIKLLQNGEKDTRFVTKVVPASLWIEVSFDNPENKSNGDAEMKAALAAMGISNIGEVESAARSAVGSRPSFGEKPTASLVFNLPEIEAAAGMSYEQAQRIKPAAERPGSEMKVA